MLMLSLLLMYLGRHSPLQRFFTISFLTQSIVDAGSFGVILFILAYTVGTLMNIPGVIFLFIGFMVYSGFEGMAIGYVASVVAVTVHFFFVRSLAGQALSEIKQPFIRKQMLRLTEHPIKTTIILRLILYVSPPVNYALALSSIKWKHSLIGTMIAFPFNILLNYGILMVGKHWMVTWFE